MAQTERANPVYLRFFQDCSLATRDQPKVLTFRTSAEAFQARAELNSFRSMLRKRESEYYHSIKDVTLRIEENCILGHPRENAPLREALEAAGYSWTDGPAVDEPLGDDYLDELLKG